MYIYNVQIDVLNTNISLKLIVYMSASHVVANGRLDP